MSLQNPSEFKSLAERLILRCEGSLGEFSLTDCARIILEEGEKEGWKNQLTSDDITAILLRYKKYVSTWNVGIDVIRAELGQFAKSIGQDFLRIANEFDSLPIARIQSVNKFERLSLGTLIEVRPTERGDKLLQSIVRAYTKTSIVQYVSTVQEAPIDELGFSQIALRVSIPKEWIEQTNRVLLVQDLGATIATKERNYLHDLWLERVTSQRFSRNEFTAEGFENLLRKISTEMNPSALLAPIEKYVEIASWNRDRRGIVQWELGDTYFVNMDDRRVRILWSNKYSPLKDFILVDQSATLWRFKPSLTPHGRLTATFVQNDKDQAKVDFLVKTVVKADLLEENGVKVFSFE